MQKSILPIVVAMLLAGSVNAGDPREQIHKAVQRVVPWLEKGAVGSSQHNKCFTCHNHGLPIMALAEAKGQGLKVDDEILTAQLTHTTQFLTSGRKRYEDGKGQGGKTLTAGYALWALERGKVPGSEVTDAVVHYLLHDQADKTHWKKSGRRPPSDGNEFTTTYVALRGIDAFDRSADHELRNRRFESAEQWAVQTSRKDTEDSVFRLKILKLTKADHTELKKATEDLLSQQRDDGGWAQLPTMQSDAYATGTALTALLTDAEVSRDDTAVAAAVQYLLQSQLDDGTWHVATRADGFQPYYESGFPHEEDQFISIAASSWAAIALLRSVSPVTDISASRP